DGVRSGINRKMSRRARRSGSRDLAIDVSLRRGIRTCKRRGDAVNQVRSHIKRLRLRAQARDRAKDSAGKISVNDRGRGEQARSARGMDNAVRGKISERRRVADGKRATDN